MTRSILLLVALVFAGQPTVHGNDSSSCEMPVAATGTYTDIEFPGGTETLLYGVNVRGEVVGSYRDPTGAVKAFLFRRGTFLSISVSGSTTTHANDINDAGRIVGQYSDSSGQHGFVWTRGEVTTIDVPGAAATSALGINNSGTIVGTFMLPGGEDAPEHGFVYRRGEFFTVDYPGASGTVLRRISNAGVVFGSAFVETTGPVDFVVSRRGFSPIVACQPENETVSGITPQGDPFGFVLTGADSTAGFLYTRRQYTLIQPPAATRVIIRDANSRYAVGEYYDGSASRGFVYSARPLK